ncbi:MAG: CBS domain-containing protein [Proteobacteria bacterium]|nr:CBS domain-containing protein [Pseudomonadota bacterium]
MQAADVMTRDVITVEPNRSVSDVARLLLDKRISAVPVVDAGGKLIGIVSEGDLLRRVETDTVRRRQGWHALMTAGWHLAAEYAKSHARLAADVMSRDVVTVSEDTPLGAIADLFEDHNIKRVPVTRDGRVVGIVSRADLLRALVAAEAPTDGGGDADDATILARLTAELRGQKWARSAGAHIEVRDGVVHLTGTVLSDAERTALRIAAERVPGVRRVEDGMAPAAPRVGM